MRSLRWILSLMLFLPFALRSRDCEAGYQKIFEPLPGDAMPVHIYELDNGLTVYLTVNDQTPTFYGEIIVRAGSKNDPADSTGLAHYLEHLMFKGSQKIGTIDFQAEKPHMDRIRDLYEQHFREENPEKRAKIYEEINRETQAMAQYAIPNELDKLYKSFGGKDINAHTSTEETVYRVSLPRNRFSQWAALEADRFARPVFRLFITELETVYEEKNRAMDDKDTILFEEVMRRLYKTHPYGQQTTLGKPEHLKKPSIKRIEEFYRTHYVPSNMAIAVSGDLDPAEAIQIIDEHFSQWPSMPLPAETKWDEAPIREVERFSIPYPGEEKVILAFRTAPINSADEEALKLFDMLLDNSVAGLINLNLNQAQKVRQAGSFPLIMNDYGAQFLWGIPKSGQTLTEVEQLLLDQIALIRSGQFEEWIVTAITNDFEKNLKRNLEENGGRVMLLRDAFVARESWTEAMGEIERMRKVTKDDIVRVANQYFSNGYIFGHRVDKPREVPFIEKPKIDAVQIDPTRQSAWAREIASQKVKDIEPEFVDRDDDFKIYEDAQGTRYYYAQNPINDLFTLSIRVEKGIRHEPRMPIAAQLIEKAGARELAPDALKKEWYRLGTEFSISTNDNETIVTISGLDRNFTPSLELLNSILSAPNSDQATLDQLVEIVLAQREDAKKDQNTLFAALTQFNRYGDESRFLRMIPSPQLRELRAQELLDLISGLLRCKKKVLYAGSLSEGEFLAEFTQTFLTSGTLHDSPPYDSPKPRCPEKTEIYFFDKELAQSLVRLEFADGKYDEDRIPRVQIFNDYFDGGMGGVVFQELREARALAYLVGAQYVTAERRDDENLMVGVIHTQPDKTDEAVVEFAKLMDEMPVSEERFRESADSVENQYRISRIRFRSILDTLISWERLSLPIDPRQQWFHEIQQSSLKDLLEFQTNRIQGRPKMISIVGDSKRMDMESLANIGMVRPLGLSDLFVE